MKVERSSNSPRFTSIVQTRVCIREVKHVGGKAYSVKIKNPGIKDTSKAVSEFRRIVSANANERTPLMNQIKDDFFAHVRDYKFKNPIRNVDDSKIAKDTFDRASVPGLTYLFTGAQEKALSQSGRKIGKAINTDKANAELLNHYKEFDEYYANLAGEASKPAEAEQEIKGHIKGIKEKIADVNYYQKVKELLSNRKLYVREKINNDIPGAPMYMGQKLEMVINAVKNDKGQIEIKGVKFVPCKPIQLEFNIFKQSA